MVTSVAVMGSTGSIGTQTLEVIRAEPDRYRVSVLGAYRSVDELVAQAVELSPEVVAVGDPSCAAEVTARVPDGVEVVVGADAAAHAAASAEVVVNGVVGFAGLTVTLAAVRAGRRLALANKESLIAAGPVVRAEMAEGAEIVPVDSEHCAIHQCLRSGQFADGSRGSVSRLLLTASGGPFRGRTRADLVDVDVDEALTHPTWSMGPKITVDSSTLMNKGLEVIEAQVLFDVAVDDIEVVVHPQSIVHSMVEFSDGSTVAQLSMPDMRMPIGYALAYPDRLSVAFGRIDWAEVGRLDFEPPDLDTFGCLGLAYDAARTGGTAPAWLNAANEVVVEAFLSRGLAWTAIADILAEVLERHDRGPATDVDAVIDADRRARAVAREVLDRR